MGVPIDPSECISPHCEIGVTRPPSDIRDDADSLPSGANRRNFGSRAGATRAPAATKGGANPPATFHQVLTTSLTHTTVCSFPNNLRVITNPLEPATDCANVDGQPILVPAGTPWDQANRGRASASARPAFPPVGPLANTVVNVVVMHDDLAAAGYNDLMAPFILANGIRLDVHDEAPQDVPNWKSADLNGLETATAIFAFDTINRNDLLGDCPTAVRGGQQHPSSNAAVTGILHGKTDNTAAVAAIARGRADNDTVRAPARRLQGLQGLWKTAAESSHVPGDANQPADHLSRGRLAAFFASFPDNTVFRRLQTTGTLLSSVYTTLSTSH